VAESSPTTTRCFKRRWRAEYRKPPHLFAFRSRGPWQVRGVATERPATHTFVLKAVLWMLLLCTLFYYPYAPDSWPSQAIDAYLCLIAQASGWLIARFGQDVSVVGTSIAGVFPLQIVKTCSALDAQALYAAAALAFPASPARKALGLALGVTALTALNLARIVCLYLVGVHAPLRFDTIHEDWLPGALVLVACLTFAGWARWVGHAEHAAHAT